jgi:hypothetical protein
LFNYHDTCNSTTLESNCHIPADQLHIPLTQVIYVGDGASDIPCFSVLNQEQGTAIGVYKERTPQEWNQDANITQGQRVVNLAEANYSEDSELS